MERQRARWSWVYFAIGAAATVASLAASDVAVTETFYMVAALQILPFLLLAHHLQHISWRPILLFAAMGACYAGERAISGNDPTYSSAPAVLLVLAAAACMAGGVISLVRSSLPGPTRGLWGDALIVGLGTWIISWATLVQPISKVEGHRDLAVVLYGLLQPTSSVVMFFAAVLMLSRHQRPPALWFIGGALSCNMIGDMLYALMDAGHMSDGGERFALAAYVGAYFAATAGFLHPSVRELGRAQANPRPDSLGRLIVTTGALLIPVVVLAGTTPTEAGDRWVRLGSALVLALVVTIRVVTAVKANSRAQAELIHGAQTDPLTGLPNRTVLLERINDVIGSTWRADTHPTLYFVDLDRFKNINDSLGHAAGDEVLVTVARRLVNAVTPDAMVARLSGDEYVVLDTTATSQGAAMACAERLLAVFREPLALSQGDVFVTASIGVAAINPTSTTSAEDLVRHADTAMYRAKDAGRNCLAVYDESMHERVAHRLAVETALYRALDRRELRLFHQPILDLQSGDVVGFEALMRWQQADGTIVSPAEFIPIAEDTGTIVPIGSWAMLEALTQLRRWIDDAVCSPSATMSVNVSPRQLSDTNFPAIVSEALTRSGVSPQLLWLEVTESVMIAEPELALATLRRLRSLGVRVALDDFGTGYSSLSLLQKFPLQRIKIDRAFVHGVADNPNDRSLVRTIVAMGRSLGLDMVAEGVESVHQLQVLSDLGCTKAQGYLISHPVPPDAMRSTVAALERLGQFPGLRTDPAFRVN
ncbi:MAG TPA: EAL domain-containing protein [Ilumatobacteraceae bacterium]|nr:EAL domain-containing protein [Ilumatobacteraceae bacterium]